MAFKLLNQPDAPTIDQGEIDSVDFDVITAGDANVGVISGCAISQRAAGANMSVDFASGSVQVGSSVASVTSGNVVVTAADGTNPRFDLAVVNNAGTKSVTAGTASANPVFPAIPANSVVLAAIYVAAGVTSIVDANIVDKRIMLADYALLGGKAGGQTLQGGTAASETLVLKGTSHATRGTVDLEDQVRLIPTSATYTAGVKMFSTAAATTITLDHANANLFGFQLRGTVVFEQAGWLSGACQVVVLSATFKNPSGEANSLGSHFLFTASGTYQADTQSVTLPTFIALNDLTTFSVASGGVLTNTAYETVRSFPTINTGASVTTLNALHAYNPLGAGTITTLCAVDIESLTRGTTNIGIRNASTTVYKPPAVQSITAATQAITVTSTLKMIDANASYTLTSAPTIADGVDGQVVTILNTDTGADVITLQDQGTLASSNLRLGAATRALGPRDSIRLQYSATVGDWLEVGFTNVL